MDERLVLGIDVGTTAVKAGLFDERGTPRGLARASYPTARRDDLVEQDPADWWRALAAALGDLAACADLTSIRSIGVVSQVNTHLCLDSTLNPLGPAVVWQDQRCASAASVLRGRLSEAGSRDPETSRSIVVHGSHLAARAAWWAEHRPGQWDETRWILSPKDYITARLTGIVASDRLASIGLVGGAENDYLPEVVGLVAGLEDRLPELRPPSEELGRLLPNDLGLPPGARVVVGTMDAWGDLYGCGAIRPGDAFVVGGTSEIVGCVSDRGIPTAGVVSFPESDGLVLHAGPTQAGGDAARWWAEARGSTVRALLSDAERAPAGSGGALFLPHLLGERAPLWDPEARGAFLGLGPATGIAELARAVLEGVAFSVRELFEAAQQAAGRPVERTALSGGTARSDLWCQIKADVLNRPLRRLEVTDTAVLGAAVLAGVGTGFYPSIGAAVERAVREDRVFDPCPEAARRYDELFEIYRESYGALRAVHSMFAAAKSPSP